MIREFSGVQDYYSNKLALDLLIRTTYWNICPIWLTDNVDDTETRNTVDKCSDNGLLYRSFDIKNNEPVFENPHLNIFAFQILYKVTEQLNIRNWETVRYLWNYYHKSSSSYMHVDDDTYPDHDNYDYYSIIYYLNTCDGGTTVGKNFYPSIEGNCILFPSGIEHCGHAPKNDKQRFVLNIMFRVLKK